jgi:hypothetical protein
MHVQYRAIFICTVTKKVHRKRTKMYELIFLQSRKLSGTTFAVTVPSQQPIETFRCLDPRRLLEDER